MIRFRDNAGKKHEKRRAWKKFESLECILADKFRNLETDIDVLELASGVTYDMIP